MMEENTLNICLRVLKRNCVRNARHDQTFSVQEEGSDYS